MDVPNNIFNPAIPYVGPIPGGLQPDTMIRIQGYIPRKANRFIINLQWGMNKPSDEIGLQNDFRFRECFLFRNHLQNQVWGARECLRLPAKPGRPFETIIQSKIDCIRMSFNGKQVPPFAHRLPFHRITHVYIEGDINISTICHKAGPKLGPSPMPNQTPFTDGALPTPCPPRVCDLAPPPPCAPSPVLSPTPPCKPTALTSAPPPLCPPYRPPASLNVRSYCPKAPPANAPLSSLRPSPPSPPPPPPVITTRCAPPACTPSPLVAKMSPRRLFLPIVPSNSRAQSCLSKGATDQIEACVSDDRLSWGSGTSLGTASCASVLRFASDDWINRDEALYPFRLL